jgi:NitT/TauT family transport system permease protein
MLTINWIRSNFSVVLTTVVLWYGASYLINTPYLMPYPHTVWLELSTNWSMYLEAVGYTSLEALGGLILAMIVAVLLVLMIYFFPLAEQYVMPYAIGIKSTPVIAVAPLLAVWCGPNYLSKIIMSALITFFPLLQGGVDGLKSIPEEVLAYVRTLGTTRRRELTFIRLHFAAPSFASALKVAVPLSVVGAMVAEFLGSDRGVGHILFANVTRGNPKVVFAAVVCVIFIGWFYHKCVSALEILILRRLKMERRDFKASA